MWMRSKTGMWHKVGDTLSDGRLVPCCQSYNLDRPNILYGEHVTVPPEGDRVCKKCSSHNE